jgi:putative ABC transport system ATP-binding protein
MQQPAIQITDLAFQWPKQKGWRLHIEHLAVQPNEHVFIKGVSGSGKSTLLGILAGVTPVKQGEIWVAGQPLHRLSAHKRDRLRAANIGFVFQQLNLIPYLSVLDNVLLPVRFAGYSMSDYKARAFRLLTRLGIDQSLLQQSAQHLSVGQQQRVAIARALVDSPQLLISDEPTSALDADNRDAFIELLLQESRESRTTVLFVSHDKSLANHFGRVLEMKEIAAGVMSCS